MEGMASFFNPMLPVFRSRVRCILMVIPVFAAAALIIARSDTRSPSVVWTWSGGVTADSVIVTARLGSGIEQASLRVFSGDTGEKVFDSGPVAAAIDRVVRFKVDRLSPDTAYRYRIQTEQDAGLEGRFHTFQDGPFSFRIGFASCATTGSSHRIFDTLRKQNLKLFIHMGDFHYEDIDRNDPALFNRAYDRVLTSPRQGHFYRTTPVAYVWDDHDFGPNDADETSPSKPAALKTYENVVPHYPLTRINGKIRSIQQAFTIGRVRFIVTDLRAERTPEDAPDGPEKSMLGRAQREWFFSQLEHAVDRYPLVVWVNTVPWITKNSPGSGHGWEPYSWERTLIADRIKELGLVKHMLILSGDAHMVAADDGRHSNYATGAAEDEPAFPVFQAAPLDRFPQIKGGPYNRGISAPNNWFPLLKAKQYGLMELQDDGHMIRVELSGHDSRGNVLPGIIIHMECDAGGCSTR